MIKSKKKLILLLLIMMVFTSGCTKQLKDKDSKIVKNEVTGQAVTENILCQPEDEKILQIYKDNNVDVSKLPTCKNFGITSGGYEGLWESLFVKPLAWLILNIGFLVGSMGLGLIVTATLIRLAVFPLTQKTAKQSQLLNEAKPEIDKIEKKYKDKKDNDSMMKKSQEISMIYKKYNINPIAGCLMAFIQLPVFIAFLEAINRVPAIFEENFLFFQLGTTPMVGLSNGNYVYLILILLVGVSTFFSLRNNAMSAQSNDSMQMMNKVMFFMILIMSIFMTSALNIYWITTNLFMIGQNMLIKKKKE